MFLYVSAQKVLCSTYDLCTNIHRFLQNPPLKTSLLKLRCKVRTPHSVPPRHQEQVSHQTCWDGRTALFLSPVLLTKTWRIQWTYQGSNLCIFSMTKKRLLMAHFWATVLGYFRCLQDLGYFRCLEIVGMDSGSFIWKDEQPSGKVRVILKSSRRRYPLTPRKTNMTIKQSNHLKMLLEMAIFRCHVSFFLGG